MMSLVQIGTIYDQSFLFSFLTTPFDQIRSHSFPTTVYPYGAHPPTPLLFCLVFLGRQQRAGEQQKPMKMLAASNSMRIRTAYVSKDVKSLEILGWIAGRALGSVMAFLGGPFCTKASNFRRTSSMAHNTIRGR